MPSNSRVLEMLFVTVLGIIVMVILATFVFFITTFVVAVGSAMAGFDPSGDFVVLSAALIVVAVIIAGGMMGRLSQQGTRWPDHPPDEDPTYE